MWRSGRLGRAGFGAGMHGGHSWGWTIWGGEWETGSGSGIYVTSWPCSQAPQINPKLLWFVTPSQVAKLRWPSSGSPKLLQYKMQDFRPTCFSTRQYCTVIYSEIQVLDKTVFERKNYIICDNLSMINYRFCNNSTITFIWLHCIKTSKFYFTDIQYLQI